MNRIATVSSITAFKTCAIRSSSNNPPKATTRPVTGSIATKAAVIKTQAVASTPVMRRCRSLSNRSNIRMKQAADPRNISGLAYIRPALKKSGLNEITCLTLGCDLRQQQLFGKMRSGGAHHIQQRRRPQAHHQHADGQYPQPQKLSTVEIFQRSDMFFGALAVDPPLHEPQRIR